MSAELHFYRVSLQTVCEIAECNLIRQPAAAPLVCLAAYLRSLKSMARFGFVCSICVKPSIVSHRERQTEKERETDRKRERDRVTSVLRIGEKDSCVFQL